MPGIAKRIDIFRISLNGLVYMFFLTSINSVIVCYSPPKTFIYNFYTH